MTEARRHSAIRAMAFRLLAGVAIVASSVGSGLAAEWPSAVILSALNGSDGFVLDGANGNDLTGGSVSSAGDINGDGLDDVIIGAYWADPSGQSTAGSSYVVFGNAARSISTLALSSLDGTTGFRLDGAVAEDRSGYSVSRTGDIDGDGFGDLIVGAIGTANFKGRAYVLFGKASGFGSAVNLGALSATDGFVLEGTYVGDRAGTSVSEGGDVNGDGIDDLIVGVPDADPDPNANFSAGSAFVVFGRTTGFNSQIELSALGGSEGVRIDGVAGNDQVGRSVAPAGDVNGDGFGDLIIGAADNVYFANSAKSYVVFGGSALASPLSLSTLDGTSGFRIEPVAAADVAGFSVSGAGDVNGDGLDDIVVGAFRADPDGKTNAGTSYVVFGKSTFTSVVSLAALDGTSGFKLVGVAASDFSGISVAAAGDVNGDGFDDVMIGAHGVDSAGNYSTYTYSGASFVVFGKAASFASALGLATLDGISGVKLAGATSGKTGFSTAGAGDFDGDGLADMIVGAYRGGEANPTRGKAYVVYGRAPDAAVSRIGAAAAQYISGGPFADDLSGVEGNDVLEGRGGGDKLKGGTGTNAASYEHAGAGVKASLADPSGNAGEATGDRYTDIRHLLGSRFADELTGNGAANRITGRKGKDRLKGGSGKDTFGYRFSDESPPGTANSDIVIDFNPGKASSAVDKIDLSAIDADTSVDGNQSFTFRGTKPFNGPGQMRLKKSGSNVIVQGNTGGSTAPEFEILLKGLASKIGRITAKDFKL